MRVLVVGCRGMLGSDLMDELAASVDGQAHAPSGVDLPDVDLCDRESLERCLRAERPEAVVNCAAFTRVDDCESQRDLAFAVNGTGPGNLASVMARACPGAPLVHLSTDYVFGDATGRDGTPWREDEPTTPRSVYAESKLAEERAVLEALPASALVVRTQWLFGTRGPNFIEAILRQVKPGASLRVVDDQVGRPTWTRHLARGIRWLLERRATGVCHVANDGSCTWFDLARAIVEAQGAAGEMQVTPCRTEDFPRPAPRPAFSVLSLDRFEELTGRRLPGWRDALAGYLAERGAR